MTVAPRLSIRLTGDTELDEAFSDYPEIAEKELKRALDLVVRALRLALGPASPRGVTGRFATSWTATRPTKIGFASFEAEIENTSRHAPFVEFGRGPGKAPPVDALIQWVQLKGLAGPKNARSVAFVVARAIGRRGTPAQWVLRDTLQKEGPRLVRRYFDPVPDRIINEIASRAEG